MAKDERVQILHGILPGKPCDMPTLAVGSLLELPGSAPGASSVACPSDELNESGRAMHEGIAAGANSRSPRNCTSASRPSSTI